MASKFSLFLFCLLLSSSIADDIITFNETQITIFAPFSNAFFKWITEDIAIALTSNDDISTTIYRTTDSGRSWVDQAAKLQIASNSQPVQIEISPADGKTIFVRGHGTVSWSSSDMGATWKRFETIVDGSANGDFEDVIFHRTQPTWAIAHIFASDYQTFRVIYSQDVGQTWKTVIANGIGSYSWGDAGQGIISDQSIYVIKPSGKITSYGDFVVTSDWGNTYTTLQSKVGDFLVLKHKIMALVFQSDGEFSLQVSDGVGVAKKKFYEATFPFGSELPNHAYVFLEDSTPAVYVGVNHDGRGDFWGNIYESDARGDRYATTLPHVNENWPYYDFEAVHGLDGVYFSSIVYNWNTGSPRTKSLRSIITFDNGGMWQSLAPPHFDSNRNPIDCTGTCALHLHGISGLVANNDVFGPFYTSEDSVGLVLATGNIGETLSYDLGMINTYFSRDGGLTWVELMKGNTVYEFGDHGGIIVLAPFNTPTTKIYYTKDQQDIQELIVSTDPVIVENIRTDPNTIGEKFMVIGSRPDKGGFVISLDFSKIFSRTCAEYDYEVFSPTDGDIKDGLNCLMGRQVSYKRRKPEAECFNPDELENVYNVTICPCREEDWECDEYYSRDNNNGQCVLIGPTPTYPPADCTPGDTYSKTKGYRQIAATYCSGGVDHSGDGPYKCPTNNKGWIAAVVIVVIVIVVIVGMFFASSNEWVREKLPFMKRIHGWKAGYLGMGNQPDSLLEEDFDTHHRDDDTQDFTIGAEELEEEKDANVLTDDDTFNPRA